MLESISTTLCLSMSWHTLAASERSIGILSFSLSLSTKESENSFSWRLLVYFSLLSSGDVDTSSSWPIINSICVTNLEKWCAQISGWNAHSYHDELVQGERVIWWTLKTRILVFRARLPKWCVGNATELQRCEHHKDIIVTPFIYTGIRRRPLNSPLTVSLVLLRD